MRLLSDMNQRLDNKSKRINFGVLAYCKKERERKTRGNTLKFFLSQVSPTQKHEFDKLSYRDFVITFLPL